MGRYMVIFGPYVPASVLVSVFAHASSVRCYDVYTSGPGPSLRLRARFYSSVLVYVPVSVIVLRIRISLVPVTLFARTGPRICLCLRLSPALRRWSSYVPTTYVPRSYVFCLSLVSASVYVSVLASPGPTLPALALRLWSSYTSTSLVLRRVLAFTSYSPRSSGPRSISLRPSVWCPLRLFSSGSRSIGFFWFSQDWFLW